MIGAPAELFDEDELLSNFRYRSPIRLAENVRCRSDNIAYVPINPRLRRQRQPRMVIR